MTENTESTPMEENQEILQTTENTVELTIDYNELSLETVSYTHLTLPTKA